MKHAFATILLALLSCTIDVRQVPAPRAGEAPIFLDERPLYIGAFDVFSGERDHLADAWRASLMSVIRSQRVFQQVRPLPRERQELAPEYLIMDVEVRPKLDDGYNWWVTWPAVYPLLGYWPVQIRTGKYKVELKYRISDQDRTEIVSDSVTEERETTVYFYGFFRPGSIEQMIEVLNLEAMESCAKKIKQQFATSRQ